MGNFLVHKRRYCYMDLQAPGRPCSQKLLSESGAVFINVRISNLMSKWFGDAQKLGEYAFELLELFAAVFSLAYKLQPAFIFIDQIDSFMGQRRTTDLEFCIYAVLLC
ncbi:hypothetical protein POTOM_042619 [Populus tomentosa]|uniref:ATPase AAA-type core domain-containing protein n=1 Tax=Populus tomentosa TaxID=118781 RepID=A0A8X8CFN4_POPTO|nr:hypothetical protein POTOM_042619 [Populus tomentosa]